MDSPSLELHEIQTFCSERYGVCVLRCQKLYSLLDTNYLLEVQSIRDHEESKSNSTRNDNFKNQVILKVSSGENFDAKHTDIELLVTEHLIGEGFVCSQFLSQQTGEFYSSIERTSDESNEIERYHLRLLTFVPGTNLKDSLDKLDVADTLRDVGEMVAELHSSLKALEEKQCVTLPHNPEDIWHLDNMTLLRSFLPYYKGDRLSCLEAVIDKFVTTIIPQSDNLSKGMVHADFHAMNIIVNFADENGQLQDLACSTKETKSESDVKKKYGVIDFADMAYSCYIFEIGRVLMSFMKDLPGLDPRYLVGYFLSGYLRHRKLSKEELDLLPDCINGVLCQCVVIGDCDFRKHPKDANLRTKIEFAWSQLYKVKSVSLQDFHDIWGSILQQDGIHEQSLVHDDIQSDIRTQNADVIV